MVNGVKRLRILVVNAITHSEFNEKRRAVFLNYASEETDVDVVSLPLRKPTLDYLSLELVNSIEVLRLLARSDLTGYHGILLNCFLDPALNEVRECFEVPVFGAGQLGMIMASLLARKIVIFSPSDKMVPRIHQAIYKYNVERSIAGIVSTKIGVGTLQDLQLSGKADKALEAEFANCCRKAQELTGIKWRNRHVCLYSYSWPYRNATTVFYSPLAGYKPCCFQDC